jgi:sporulation protein YlmC with PRC-barrel domain
VTPVGPTEAVLAMDATTNTGSPGETELETTQFTIGAEVSCSDGLCGEMTRVVVDPIARMVTHLVVEPEHRQGSGRLVPLSIVDASSGEIALSCTTAEFERLDAAEETEFLPASSGYAGYAPGQALYWPHYGLAMGGLNGMGSMGVGPWLGTRNAPQETTYDAIPLGEVAVHRGEKVRATDGDIGCVEGLVVDTGTHYVTHVLLQEGHLWGRKDVAIPIRAVTRVGEVIELNMTKHELGELPSIEIDQLESNKAET